MKIPVIKGRIGSWIYYAGTMSFKEVSENVSTSVDEIYSASCLAEVLQRELTTNYISIKTYLLNEKERFFNALILAIFDGDPQWLEVEFKGAEKEYSNVGFLEFTGDEKIFPVDGQHRVAGIKAAVKENSNLNKETVPVIFIAHDNSEEGRRKTRKLFSTLNRRAKPVGADENIALDEDDINAIITRELVQSFPLYMGKNVSQYSGKHISRTNKDAFTSLITLYQCVEIIIKHDLKKESIINKKYKEYLLYRPNDEKIDKMKAAVFSIMESFVKNTAVIKKYVNIETECKALEFRNADGGNLLFRPAALTEYFNAALVLVDAGHTYDEAFSLLDRVPQELKDTPWKGFLWDGSNIIARASKPTIKNLLVFMSQRDALTENEYKKMLTQYSSSINVDIARTEEILKQLLTERQAPTT